jgi:hypothetical protein
MRGQTARRFTLIQFDWSSARLGSTASNCQVHRKGSTSARTGSVPGLSLRKHQQRLVAELANHPNRLLVTATPETGETYAEVAHEAVFKRWEKLRDWIAAEREFLACPALCAARAPRTYA